MNLSRSLRGMLCASVSAAAAFAATGAAAQVTNTNRTPNPPANENGSGELVVTARRVAESIRTVPVTVQAFNTQKLKEASITETSDLMYHVTGLYMGGAGDPNNTIYILRGVGVSGQQGGFNPGVMSYFAEVPLPPAGQSQPQYDIANIQVLKGPQGTLFGRNTTGGAVLVYPQTPNYRGYNGYVQGAFGSYNQREGEAAVNLPLVEDKLAVRIAVHGEQRDGFIKNVTPGGPNESAINNWGMRAQVRWDPTANVTNNLMFDYFNSNTSGPGITVVQPNGQPLPVAQGGYGSYFKTASPPGLMPFSRSLQWGLTDRLEVSFGSIQFVNIAAYRHAQFDAFGNGDGTALGTFITTEFTNEADFTEEAQLKGDAFDSKVHWIAGAFYLNVNPLSGNDFYNVIFGPSNAGFPFLYRQSEAIYGNGIIHLDNLLQGLEADLGMRYTWDQVKLCTAIQGDLAPPLSVGPSQCSPTTPGIGFANTATGGSSAPTWSIGLNWKVNKDLFLYAVTRRGYRSGGVNGPKFTGALAAVQSYKPELVTDFEVGERSSFHVGGMSGTLDMDYFRAQTDNVQQTAFRVSTGFYNTLADPANPFTGLAPPPSNPGAPPNQQLFPNDPSLGPPPPGFASWIPCPAANEPSGLNPSAGGTGTNFDSVCNAFNDPIETEVEFNAGTLVSQGFEFQATLSPIENLTFSAGGTIYNFNFTAGANSIPSALLAFYRGGNPGCSPSACLARNYGVTQTYTAGMRYSLPLHNNHGTLVFTADAYWSLAGMAETDYVQPPYDIINLRLDWNHVLGGPVDLSIFAKNISDTHYEAEAGPGDILGLIPGFAPQAGYVMGEPRVIGAQVRYEFGN